MDCFWAEVRSGHLELKEAEDAKAAVEKELADAKAAAEEAKTKAAGDLEAAVEKAKADAAEQVTKLTEENYDRIQEDISWFIKKFDYRYENESWKNSKDAVERTVNKARGWCVGKEPIDTER